jgi:hypothetical protein
MNCSILVYTSIEEFEYCNTSIEIEILQYSGKTDQIQEFSMKNDIFKIPNASENEITHKIIFFVFCLCSIASQASWWREVEFFTQINEECNFTCHIWNMREVLVS